MKIFYTLQNLFTFVFLILLSVCVNIFSQQSGTAKFQYLSPLPGSEMNQPETNIIIRYGTPFNSGDVLKGKLIEVSGEISGIHSGKIILTEDDKTMLFTPEVPFALGENVTVKFLRTVKTKYNKIIPDLNFTFRITKKDINKLIIENPEKYFSRLNPELLIPKNTSSGKSSLSYSSVMNDTLPEDFPTIVVDSLNNPTPGRIFLAPFSITPYGSNYLIITDNYGIPVYYKKTGAFDLDFKKQPGGELTYFDGSHYRFYVLDSSYQVIDSLTVQNGYPVDFHELLILDNNHSFMLGHDYQQVAMDTIFPGGNPNAIVNGMVIQELDENKNVVFQWRSFDHYNITDATDDIDLTDSLIDYVHANAIDVDDDGNLLVSCRHMDEVTKINRQTGDIIWRWGGEHCKNNQFTFINDPAGFSHQHYIRRFSNGNLSLFDNGNLHSPPSSRAAEYQVDEENKWANLVWEYRNDPLSYSSAMGSVNRLFNHNTIIGWGTGVNPAISEVDPTGEVALFMTLPDTVINYRGFKFPWKTNLFITNPDSLVFGYVPLGDSLEMPLEIINKSDQTIEINNIYKRETAYQINATLPITIPPFGTQTVIVKFKPEQARAYPDEMHLRWNTNDQRIARVVTLTGSADPNLIISEDNNGMLDYYLGQNYPNPFNPSTKISWSIASKNRVLIVVYDVLGRKVQTLVNDERSAGRYEVVFNASNLPSGIYFYTIQSGSFMQTKKMLLLK